MRKPDGLNIAKTEIRVVEFFLRVIKEGGVPEVVRILKDPAYIPKKPFKIGRGLTKGLNAVVRSRDFKPVKPDQ
jgi:hypothetical protein